MALRIASEGGARTGERLTVGVAARLSQYLRVLIQARKMGKDRISSQEISEYTNINATQIRRDLSAFGKFGKRGVGYNIESLIAEIRKILRTQGQHNIALFGGAGSARRSRARRSSPITASTSQVRSTGSSKVGEPIGNTTISAYSDLRDIIRDKKHHRRRARRPARGGPARRRRVVEAGVKIIFNYTEALLDVPQDVTVHTTSPAVELLYALYFYLT